MLGQRPKGFCEGPEFAGKGLDDQGVEYGKGQKQPGPKATGMC